MFPLLRPTQNTAATIQTTEASVNRQQQSIPVTNFSRHRVQADGDCLFRAVHMGLNQTRVEASPQEISTLRQRLNEYVGINIQGLSSNPFLGGEETVQNLQEFLATPRQWNADSGDLVPPLLAQVLGRDLVILQEQAGANTFTVKQSLLANNAQLPAELNPNDQPPIYLLHTAGGTHYDYLQPLGGQNVNQQASNQQASQQEADNNSSLNNATSGGDHGLGRIDNPTLKRTLESSHDGDDAALRPGQRQRTGKKRNNITNDHISGLKSF